MKVGMMLPTLQSLQANAAVLEMSVALGADSLWSPDHLLGIAHPAMWSEYGAASVLPDPDAWLDPFCLAAALGDKTELPFGTCVTDGTRRRGGDLARTVLTLNDACRGGYILGIGAGEAESLLPFGYDFSKPVGTLEQTLKDLRSMLDHGRMPDGGHGRTGLPRGGPKPPPQVWVAASRERSLELTGRYGDGWMPVRVTPDEYASKRLYLNQVAASVGRPPLVGSMFPLMLMGESRDSMAAAFDANPLGKLILLFAPATLWQRHGLAHPSGPNCRGTPDAIPHALDPDQLRRIAREIPLEMVEEFIFCGSGDEIADRLAPYAEGGLSHVVLADFSGLIYTPDVYAGLVQTQLPQLVARLKAMPIGDPLQRTKRTA